MRAPMPMETAAHSGSIRSCARSPYRFDLNKGGTCRKVGNDTVNGRSTVKYEGTNANGDSSTFWIDPKLRPFTVSFRSEQGRDVPQSGKRYGERAQHGQI